MGNGFQPKSITTLPPGANIPIPAPAYPNSITTLPPGAKIPIPAPGYPAEHHSTPHPPPRAVSAVPRPRKSSIICQLYPGLSIPLCVERWEQERSGMNEGPMNYGFGACLQIALQLLSPKVHSSSGTTSHPNGAKHPHAAPPGRENNGPIKTSKLTTTRIPLGREGDGNIQFHPLINISYHRDGERIGLENRGVVTSMG